MEKIVHIKRWVVQRVPIPNWQIGLYSGKQTYFNINEEAKLVIFKVRYLESSQVLKAVSYPDISIRLPNIYPPYRSFETHSIQLASLRHSSCLPVLTTIMFHSSAIFSQPLPVPQESQAVSLKITVAFISSTERKPWPFIHVVNIYQMFIHAKYCAWCFS